MTDTVFEFTEFVPKCPACGEPIDYCQGHRLVDDFFAVRVLAMHNNDDHRWCFEPSAC